MPLSKRPRRYAILLAVLSSTALVAPQAYSFERVVVGARHFFQCLGLMLSKPDVHAQECLPNRVESPFGSMSGTTGGPSVAAPPPVDDDDEEPICNCGPCNPT